MAKEKDNRLKELSKKILFNNKKEKENENKYSNNIRLYKIAERTEKQKTILLMGMNPSESEDKKDICRDEDYIEYIPNASRKLNKEFEKLIYNGYFKPNYELFENVRMSWTLFEDKIEKIKNTSKKVDKVQYEIDMDKNKDILVFADLIYYHHKNQKDIEDIIENTYKNNRKDLRCNIKAMINEHIELFYPRLIVVTNSYASKLIYEMKNAKENEKYDVNIKEDYIEYEYKDRKIPIILSGMVSGQHALDKFSYIRLKNRISDVQKTIIL